jgi:hypothetical protein
VSEAIDIALPTWNGAKYLDAQLDSLRAQEQVSIRIIAHDDGSADDTPALLRRFADSNPDVTVVLADKTAGLGAARNFAHILAHTSAPYVMLCDQDDVWLPHKAALTLTRMQAMEAEYGTRTPILVHTDANVTDAELNITHPSFSRVQKLKPASVTPPRLLVQNVALGCSCMMNRALLEAALPLPDAARMHDHWLALVAAWLGRIEYIGVPTLLYRQHGGNAVGAARTRRTLGEAAALVRNTAVAYAEILLERHAARIPTPRRYVLEDLAECKTAGKRKLAMAMLEHGILRVPAYQNMALLLA